LCWPLCEMESSNWLMEAWIEWVVCSGFPLWRWGQRNTGGRPKKDVRNILQRFVEGWCAVGVLSFAIVVTSVLLPRLARLNACLPNQSLGFGEGQPIGIEYHNQEFQGSSQDLDLMDSKSKFRHIRVEALFFEKPFPFGPHCSYFTASIFWYFVSATPIHPAISLARRAAYFHASNVEKNIIKPHIK